MEEVVAIIQAHAVLAARSDPNLEVLTEHGYLVVEKRLLELSESEAHTIIGDDNARLYLGGPVLAVLLRRENAYDTWERVRAELDDTYSSTDSYTALRDKYTLFAPPRVLERSVIVVKPDHKLDEFKIVMETLESNDFVVLDRVPRQLSAELAESLFGDRKYDGDELKYLKSDVSMVLIVEKVGAIDEWRLIMGPEDPRLAKLIAPSSLRARLGVDRVHNAVYASDSAERALRDIRAVASLFPLFFPVERTLAILKPDTARLLDPVRDEIEANGFTILASEEMHLSLERAEQFYAALRGRSFFETITRYLSSGPVIVLLLAKPKAVDHWRKLIGPASLSRVGSLRQRFGTDENRNGFHGSESAEVARKEITLFFPLLSADKDEKTTRRQQVENFLTYREAPSPYSEPKKSLNDVLVDGLTQLCRVKPVGKDAILYLADWLLQNNPNKPRVILAVEEPKVEVKKPALPDIIAWVVGGPGTNKSSLCSQVAIENGYEVLSCSELSRAAVSAATPFGDVIKECNARSAPVPCHVISTLLAQAMATSKTARLAKAAAAAAAATPTTDDKKGESKGEEKRGSGEGKRGEGKSEAKKSGTGPTVRGAGSEEEAKRGRYLVTDFPYTLDQVFDFETRGCAASLVIYLDGGADVLLRRALEHKETKSESKSTLQRRIATFKEDVAPIIEHYSVFKKVKSISVDSGDDNVRSRLADLIK